MKNLQVIIVLVISTSLMRLLPHAPNFTPVIALAIFSGAMIPNKSLAVALTLAAMFLSDLFLGLHSTMTVVYVSLILIVLLSSLLQKTSLLADRKLSLKSLASLLGFSVFSSLVFFLFTNFGVWVLQDMYPKTMSGLMLCYVAALPFLNATITSTVFYSVVLFAVCFRFESKQAKLQTC